MDTTIRGIDERAYRELKARAALEGRTIGAVLTDLILSTAGPSIRAQKRGRLADIKPESFPKGTERLSEEIDKILYGA